MPQSRREQIVREVMARCQAAIAPVTVLRQPVTAITREQAPALVVSIASDAPVKRSNDRVERELVLRIIGHARDPTDGYAVADDLLCRAHSALLLDATLGGLAVSLAGVELWQPAMLAIKMLGDISIPLMLFALGVRISESRIGAIRLGVIGAVARPAIGLALSFVLVWLIPLPERERALLIVFGALPPAVLNYMFAERYNQEPEKVASMVLLGNVAAVLFLPVALAISL